jgi:hypothetical protein
MPSWLNWIAAGLGWLFKTFINKTPAATVEGEKAGAATQALADTKAALQVEQKVAQAEVDAPSTQAALVAEMQKGTF